MTVYCNRFGFIVDPDTHKYFTRDKCIEVTPNDREGMIVRLVALFKSIGGEPAFPEVLVDNAIRSMNNNEAPIPDHYIVDKDEKTGITTFMRPFPEFNKKEVSSTNQQLSLF